MSDAETLATYAQKAGDYVDMIQGSVAKDPLFGAFLDGLPAHCSLLDLGCGPGHFAAAMAAAGHTVTATDAVQEMVDLAAQHDGVNARLARFDDITGDNIYDGIWANFCLLHAPRDAMPKHLAALHQALKPKGRFHIALKSGTGSERDSIGRHYTYYTQPELTELLTTAGFTLTSVAQGSGTSLAGVMEDWIAVSAHG